MLQKKYKSLITLTAALLSGGMLPCLQAAVVTSVKPLGFIAAAISDGVTPVEVVLPDGASEHDYALRPSDVRRVQGADLLVWIGPEMESFLTRSAGQLAPQKNLMLAGLSSVQTRLIAGQNDDEDQHTASEKNAISDGNPELSGGHHHHGEYNMHLWMSPEIALLSATAIHDRLVELMPAKKDKLDSNLMTFKVRLADADNRIRKQLAPVSLKGYFVFHDAYSYFEKHYGLSPAGHFAVNPEIQPGAQRLHNIRTQLVQQKAVCVFAEPQFRPAVIDAVAKGTNVRKGTLDPLGMSISLDKDSYVNFLSQLSSQYASCLKG